MLQELINGLNKELDGYHFTIMTYPAGGLIETDPCEECGKVVSASASWKYKGNKAKSLDEAVVVLKRKLGLV
jgi:hypothetical protein